MDFSLEQESDYLDVYKRQSNLHAGKEFYLNSLQENYQLSFSDDFADVMEQIETEYKAANQLTDVSDSEGCLLYTSCLPYQTPKHCCSYHE